MGYLRSDGLRDSPSHSSRPECVSSPAALMFHGLSFPDSSLAGRSLERPELIDAAADAADFISSTLFREERLFASYKDGETRFPAYLDDHAFLLDALLELLQARPTTVLFVTHSIPEAVFLGQKVLMLASHPGRLREVVDIDLPTPRQISLRDTPEFIKYTAYLRELLETC